MFSGFGEEGCEGGEGEGEGGSGGRTQQGKLGGFNGGYEAESIKERGERGAGPGSWSASHPNTPGSARKMEFCMRLPAAPHPLHLGALILNATPNVAAQPATHLLLLKLHNLRHQRMRCRLALASVS
jgi:hypothetical protein